MPLAAIYVSQLESPGTKAYTIVEARRLFSAFDKVEIRTVLTHGDLLESDASNVLVGTDPAMLAPALKRLFADEWKKCAVPETWDGNTGTRIVATLAELLGGSPG